MAVTTRTQITDAQTEYFNARLLMRAKAYLAFNSIGQEKPIPMNSSNQVRFRRYGVMAAVTTNLAEATAESPDRTAVQLSITDVTGNIIRRGNAVAITDVLAYQAAEDVIKESQDVCVGQNAGESIDIYYRNVIDAGTTVVYSNGTTRLGINTVIDGDDIRRTVRTLELNNARKITQVINASTGVGTVPVRPCYVAVCSPRTAFTLRQLTGWQGVETYAAQMGIEGLMDGEIGQVDGVRFVQTTQARSYDAGGAAGSGILTSGTPAVADVYETLVFGQEAYGRCPLKGKGLVGIYGEELQPRSPHQTRLEVSSDV